MSLGSQASRRAILGLLVAVRRLGVTLAFVAQESLSRAGERYRLELRRVASVMALSLAATLLGFAALAFLAFTVMLAFWSTHPVAVSASIAAMFAAFSLAAGLLVRRFTRG